MKSDCIIPPALKNGDVISLISTARKIDPNDVQFAVKTIESWGFEVKLGKNLLSSDLQFCGTDVQRASDLQDAIDDAQVKAIICFRGGYGTVRILDKINLTSLISHPKWIVGYSDVTALHNALQKINVASIHGTMPVNFKGNTPESLSSLKTALSSNEELVYNVPAHSLNRVGETEGKVVGGNLSMLYSLNATPFDIDTTDCILFLEDLDEYLYHIDRMMQNLKLGGKLSGLKGLIVGGMTDMNDNDTPFGFDAEQIIYNAVSEYSFPVCFDFPAGHIADNRVLKLGALAQMKVDKTGVTFLQ